MEIDILDNEPHPGHSSHPAPEPPPVSLAALLESMREAAKDSDSLSGEAIIFELTVRELSALLAEIDRIKAAHDGMRYYASITDGA